MTRLPIFRAFGTLLLKLCGPATLGPHSPTSPRPAFVIAHEPPGGVTRPPMPRIRGP